MLTNGIYQNFFDIIHQYIYGGAQLTPNMELVAILMSTIGSLFVLSVPFIIVYFVLKLIFKAFDRFLN